MPDTLFKKPSPEGFFFVRSVPDSSKKTAEMTDLPLTRQGKKPGSATLYAAPALEYKRLPGAPDSEAMLSNATNPI